MHFKKGIALGLAACLCLAQGVLAADEKTAVSAENGKVKIEISGCANLAGQGVTVQILKPGIEKATQISDIVYQNQTLADENGAYMFAVPAADSMETGDYTVKIVYEDGTVVPMVLEYRSANDVNQVFASLKNIASADELKKIIENYDTAWNFDLSLYKALDAAAQKHAVEIFIQKGGCASETTKQASDIFDSAVVAAAASGYAGDYEDLVTGDFGAYTKLAETMAYIKFAARTDLEKVAEKMRANSFADAADAHKKFEIYIALSVIENAGGWFDVKEAAEIAAPLLGLDMTAFSKHPEDMGKQFAGKQYTPESFAQAFSEASYAMQSEVTVIFKDVAEQALWANSSVNALHTAGIVSGTGDGIFEPNGSVTREQFAKMIVSLIGDMEYVPDSSFSDVPETEWYATFVAMAKSAGIVNGVSETEFGVGQNITREQMAAMIYRAGLLLGYAPAGEPKQFTDAVQISDYAKSAVDQLTAGGVINGMEDGSFCPQATATRAEAACMIYNMMQAVQHRPESQTGLEPLTGLDFLITYQENFNSLVEKDYKARDLVSFHGWYFVPSGTSYISAVKAPAGKDSEIPFSAFQKAENKQDVAICIKAESSGQSAFFDTQPFFMSQKTLGKLRLEMNLYLKSDSTSPNYKVFDTQFMSYVNADLSHAVPFIYFAGDTGVYYYDANEKGVRCGSYTPETWIHVAADLDTEKQMYTLYLDGVAVAENIPFSNKDILWDGTDPEPGLRKIRLRTGVAPNTAGTSQAYLDDFLWARYTDAPAIFCENTAFDGKEIRLSVPENIAEDSLGGNISVAVNGKNVGFTGALSGNTYILTLNEAVPAGADAAITVGRWVSAQNGILTGTPYTITVTAR